MRYYYDCPYKVLYMLKNFGVKCEAEYFEEISFDELIKGPRRIYVAPESEEIMKPRTRDYGLDSKNFLVGYNGDGWGTPHDVKIIMRDNKHFFQAEVESG